MTDFFKRPGSRRWGVFWLVLIASWAVDVGKVLQAWFGALGDNITWAQVPWKQKWSLYCSIVIGLGSVFLQLKSRAWQDATKKELEPAGGP